MLDGNSRPLFPRLRELAYVPPFNIFVWEMAFVISLTGAPSILMPPPLPRTGRNNLHEDLPARQDPPILRRIHLNSGHPAFWQVQGMHIHTKITLFNATYWNRLTHLRLCALLQPETIMNIAAMSTLEELHILLLQESLPHTTQNHGLSQYLRKLTTVITENILPAAQFLRQFDPLVTCLTIDAPSLFLPCGIIDHLDRIGTGLQLPRIQDLLKKFKLPIQQRFNLANRVDEDNRLQI